MINLYSPDLVHSWMSMDNLYLIQIILVVMAISRSQYSVLGSKNGIDGIKIDVIPNDSHMLLHDLKYPLPAIEHIPVREQNQLTLLNITINPHINLQLNLRIQNAIDQFYEVPHSSDDNQFVLQSNTQSDIYHLRQSMLYIMDNYCMRPVPKQYYIIKDTFKGRATLAYPEVCGVDRISSVSNECPYPKFKFYVRSINDPCTWQKDKKFDRPDEELEQLQYNLNSVFCVDNNPLLNDLFREKFKEGYRFLLNPECEIAKARCIDCQILRCKTKQSCCTNTAQCLLNKNCLKYHSAKCDGSNSANDTRNDTVCIQDTTYMLTLTPDFDFDQHHFMCHMQRDNKVVNMSGTISLNLSFPNNMVTMTSQFDSVLPNGSISNLSHLKISIVPSLIAKMNNVIFERRGYEYFMHSLKSAKQFDPVKPKIHNHFAKSYIKVQFQTPFQFTTERWSKETCQVNISVIHSAQSMHDNHSTVPVRLLKMPIRNSNSNGVSSFHYKILPVALDSAKLILHLTKRTFILSSIICRQSNKAVPENIGIDVDLNDTNSWILHIRGDFLGHFTIFSVSITDTKYRTAPIFNSEILVGNRISKKSQKIISQNISLDLSISVEADQRRVTELSIVISHCGFMISTKSLFLKTGLDSSVKIPLKDIETPKDISDFLLTFFLSVLVVCFLYFMLLALQAVKRSTRVSHTKIVSNRREVSKKLNHKFLMKVILYLTCKLFYTVSFTLSLILSVCLSLNSILSYSNSSVNSPLLNNAKNLSVVENHKIIPCSDKTVDQHFLMKVANVISNNEHIRMNSSQSTTNSLLQLIQENPINKTENFLKLVFESIYRSIERSLRNIVGSYVRIYEETKDNRWIATFRIWNHSITSVTFNYSFKEEYLNTFNLFTIYSATAALENCAIFNKKFVYWSPQLSLNTNHSKYFRNTMLFIPRGVFYRYFFNHKGSEHKLMIYSKMKQHKENKNSNLVESKIMNIRLIFMVIDTVLIVYRFYWTFSDIQQMWRSKKEIIQFNHISLKNNNREYVERAKPSTMQWTKQHHLDCLISGHLIIAAVIIIVSIICTNLVVLLTSKDHAIWLSRKTGNIIRIRSLRLMKDRMYQLNLKNIVPVQRHWEYLKTIKVKEILSHRKFSKTILMHLELYFNKYYFYELCHFQKVLSLPKQTIDFCSSIMPGEDIIPGNVCMGLTNCPRSLLYNPSTFTLSRTIYYFNSFIHFSIHTLAIIILLTAIIGIVKIFRKQFGDVILRSEHSSYIIYVSHEQYISQCQSIPRAVTNIYNRDFSSNPLYQCWKHYPNKKKITIF